MPSLWIYGGKDTVPALNEFTSVEIQIQKRSIVFKNTDEKKGKSGIFLEKRSPGGIQDRKSNKCSH